MLFSLRALVASGSFLVLLGAFAACGSDEPIPVINDPNKTNPLPDGALPGDGGLTGDGAGILVGPGTVSGKVVGRSTLLPLASRQMKVRDGAGKIVDVTTDAAGAFSAPGITPPYDIWIAPSGATVKASGTAYLGLRASTVKIFGDAVETPAPTKNATSVSISWNMPSCTGGACYYFVVGRTPEGWMDRASDDQAPGAFTLNFPMTWHGPATTPCEISLFIAGRDGVGHFYTTTSTTLTSGTPATLSLTPQTIPTLGPATLAAATAPPAGYQPADARVFLHLPGAAGSVEIKAGSLATPLSFGVPTLAGSTLSFHSTQYGPSPPFNILGGVKVGIAPAATAHTIELGDPSPIASPQQGGSVSIANGAIEFHQVPPPRFRIVTWVAPDRPGFVAVLADQNLPIQRVSQLSQVTKGMGELVVEEHARALDEYVADVTAEVNTRYSTTSFSATLN